jgi:hypothetical protein
MDPSSPDVLYNVIVALEVGETLFVTHPWTVVEIERLGHKSDFK